jgi:hypothetical protein
MHTGPSEASILRSLLEKETKELGRTKEKLEHVLEAVRNGQRLILKNRNQHVDQQILAFGDVLDKIREIIE